MCLPFPLLHISYVLYSQHTELSGFHLLAPTNHLHPSLLDSLSWQPRLGEVTLPSVPTSLRAYFYHAYTNLRALRAKKPLNRGIHDYWIQIHDSTLHTIANQVLGPPASMIQSYRPQLPPQRADLFRAYSQVPSSPLDFAFSKIPPHCWLSLLPAPLTILTLCLYSAFLFRAPFSTANSSNFLFAYMPTEILMTRRYVK